MWAMAAGLARQHAGNGEEAGLQDRVGAGAEADVTGDLGGVDDEEAEALVDDLGLHRAGQAVPDVARTERAVKEKDGAGSGDAQDILPLQEAELMAGDEARLGDQVGRLYRFGTEA